MDSQIVVTIQCLAFNHEHFIRKTLDGFVMQKTSFAFEAIIHDDASTDRTAEIIKEYADKYPKIIIPVLDKVNLYSKHNHSLEKVFIPYTRGKYIAFCEGDDYWTDPYKLQKQVDLLENNPDCSLCSSGYDSVSGEKKWTKCYESLFFFDSFRWTKEWLTKTLTVVFRTEMLGEYWDKLDKYKYARDIHIMYHLLKRGNGIYLPEVTGVYNYHSGGIYSMMPSNLNAEVNYHCAKEIYLNNFDKISQMMYITAVSERLKFPIKKSDNISLIREVWFIATLRDKARLLVRCFLSIFK